MRLRRGGQFCGLTFLFVVVVGWGGVGLMLVSGVGVRGGFCRARTRRELTMNDVPSLPVTAYHMLRVWCEILIRGKTR